MRIQVLELFDGMAIVAGPDRPNFGLNFNRFINPYLKVHGPLAFYPYIRFYQLFTTNSSELLASLHKTQVHGSVKLTAKNSGASCGFYSSSFLDAVGFNDEDQYSMDLIRKENDSVIFKILKLNPSCGVKHTGMLFKVHAPSLTNRLDQIALKKIQAKDNAPAFKVFVADVERITDEQEREFGYLFKSQHLKDKPGVSRDHMFSKKEAFIEGIPAEIIGNYTNIEYMLLGDNSSKGSKCSKTYEELLDDFFWAKGMKVSQSKKYCEKHNLKY